MITVIKVGSLIVGKFIRVVKFIPNVSEKGAVMFILLREVEFVVMLKFSSLSLCEMLSIDFRSSELVFIVVLFWFKRAHVSCAPTDPITSVVFRKSCRVKVIYSVNTACLLQP